MKKLFSYIFLTLYLINFRYPLYAQLSDIETKQVDSLNTIINNSATPEVSKIGALISLSDILYVSNADTALSLCLTAKTLVDKALQKPNIQTSIKNILLKHLADALNNIAILEYHKGNLEKALEFHHKSLNIREKIAEKIGVATSLLNLGYFYTQQGEITKALEYYHRSLKIQEEIGDKDGLAYSLNNIGYINQQQGNFVKALEYYNKSLKIREKIQDNYGIAYCLNNIGSVLDNEGKNEEAIVYYEKSIQIQKNLGNKKEIASSLNNFGNIYKKQGKYEEALNYFFKSLRIREEIKNKSGISNSLNNIGSIYFKQQNFKEALNYTHKSLVIAKELGYPDYIKSSSLLLSQIYEKQGNGLKALEMHKLFISMRDSINNIATQKAAIQKDIQYNFEKKITADSLIIAKEMEIKNKELEKQKAEIKARRNQQYALWGGLTLVLFFSGFIYNRFKVTQKQKIVIEKQKTIVEKAHRELEDKNKEILDSINYAKRIQNAILPPLRLIKENLPQSFILYRPKDVVAGDFYWMEHKNEKLLIAACDCTGHGVPGAMVSVVCVNGLNRSVREHCLTDPGKILDKTREIVIAEFEKSDEDVKDGMDVSLCCLDLKSNTLNWAGANNPLWIIRKNGKEVEEIKANKQPIGKTDNSSPFTAHEIQLNPEDTIYIFTDGYADQFGGEKGKKFKAAQLKELLLSIQQENMENQWKIVAKTFDQWKGSLEQVDDVCVIGFRV